MLLYSKRDSVRRSVRLAVRFLRSLETVAIIYLGEVDLVKLSFGSLRSSFGIGVLSAAMLASLPASSQSLKVETPAPLQQGSNRATVDSMVGDHYWYFYADPGRFHIDFTYGNPQEGFSTGGRPAMRAAANPKTPGSVLTLKEAPGSTTYDGNVTTRTRILVGITPAPGSLVRQTSEYHITVSGNVSFADASAGPSPIVGIYVMKVMESGRPDPGAIKFLANGTIITSNGGEGTWKLFDGDVYTVILSGQRMTLNLQRGRGLLDPKTNFTVFEMQR